MHAGPASVRAIVAGRWLLLVLPLLLAGCTALSFAVANAPASHSDSRRIADIAYGDLQRQTLDIYVPPMQPTGKLPVVVFWYGGAWIDGSKNDYRFVGAAFAELGYVTVVPDYRLYPDVRFPAFIDDGALAVKWVHEHAAEHGGDPSRIVLIGHSAGAHLAAMLALNRSYLNKAGVDPASIAGLVGISGPYDLDPTAPDLAPIFPAPATAADWQVLRFALAGAPPALLLYGDRDDVVPRSAIDGLEAALRKVGSDVETRIYEGADHRDTLAAISVPARDRAPVLADIAAFLVKISARRR